MKLYIHAHQNQTRYIHIHLKYTSIGNSDILNFLISQKLMYIDFGIGGVVAGTTLVTT